jgi:LuxR family maltose regulon positive regulatory protein
MVEAKVSARPEPTSPQPDVLLATKLALPKLRPGLVARSRLTDRLEQGLGHGVVAVVAAAGYGKTVLLAHWAGAGRRRSAWLTLDAGDNDPARFWRHLIASMDRALPGIEDRVGPLLGPPPPPSFERLATAVINALVEEPGGEDLLLVLDDYHVIDSETVHASLGFLLEHRPPALRLVVASRSDPPLALARLRARGELVEIRTADLRFTDAEAAELLSNMAARPGLVLPDSAATALAARTEGWAAGLQLAALSLRGQADVAGFVAALAAATATSWTAWPRRSSSARPSRSAPFFSKRRS